MNSRKAAKSIRARKQSKAPKPPAKRKPPRGRRGPVPGPESELKVKLSVSISPTDIEWANSVATERGVALSTVFQDALAMYRQDWKLAKLIEVTRPEGAKDPTPKELEEVYAEWRAAGLRV